MGGGNLVSGSRHGKWTVVTPFCDRRRYALVRCDCGVEAEVLRGNIQRGQSTKCFTCAQVKHSMSGTLLYGVWEAMRGRCNNPNDKGYKNYGARGISVCDRWESFANFFADMGTPAAGMTLDRKNNDLGYSPDNCQWATRRDQVLNRRKVKGSSQYRGVSLLKSGRWQVNFTHNYKQKHVGSFDNEMLAAIHYDCAVAQLGGYSLNFPEACYGRRR